MKKQIRNITLSAALAFSTVALAKDYSYEVTPMIGYNIAEGNIDLDDYAMFGGEFQFNDFNSMIKPEISIFYSKADYENSSEDTDVWRIALNGVYEYEKVGNIIPLAKIGLGYENMSDTYSSGNHNSPFIDAGVGAKIPFTDRIALKLEAVYMLKYNDDRYDNNLAVLVGLNIAFGEKAQKAAPKKEEVVAVVDGDDDNDGVLNSVDTCPNSEAGVQVDSKGCKIDGDDDNDGIANSVDACLATAAGATVDASGCVVDGDDDKDGVLNSKDICPKTEIGVAVNDDGCPKTINLNINFENNSAKIKDSSLEHLKAYSDFLKQYPNYSAKIVGFTDSKGSASHNKKLSQKRADAVVEHLVTDGVNPSQLSAEGKGEENPIADNSTAEGRAQNRRIEAELIKQ